MTGAILTLTVPAPLARELGSATQDFLADLLLLFAANAIGFSFPTNTAC